MIIPKRIEAIASLICDSKTIIDVGCDHAYLDIYLALNRENVKCFACDINKNALEMAKKNIIRYNLQDKIDIVLTDGIDGINILKNTIIVISGMGTSTIKHILSNKNANKAYEIIIQSNNDLEDLRKYMISNGYYINDEKSVLDRGKYYIIISFKKGIIKYNKYEYYFGPVILKNSKDNIDYLEYLLRENKNKYKKIPFKYFKLRFSISRKICKLKKIMHNIK